MARRTPKLDVIRRLFALSGNECAFPGCTHVLIDDGGEFVAQVCHIEAAEEGGERYNLNQTDEERRAFENLIILCHRHHVNTNNILKYPASELMRMKAEHEAKHCNKPYVIPEEFEDNVIDDIAKKLDKIYDIVKQNKSLLETGNDIGSNTNEKVSRVLEAVISLQSRSFAFDESKIYSEQLEFIKQFRKEGKAQTALDALRRFKTEKWDKIDEELRFKILANLATILFDLGKKKEAASYLLEIERIDFRTEVSLAYLCLAYAIIRDNEKFDALFNGRELANSLNVNLWVAFVHAKHNILPPREIKKQIPPQLLKQPEILFTLGELFVDVGDVKDGFTMLEQAVILTGDTIEKRWQVQGIVAAKKLTILAAPEKISLHGFSNEEKTQILDCKNKLSEAWDYVSKTELAAASWYLIMNRGIAHKIMQDTINAEKDLQEAWRLSQNFTTFKNLLLQYFETSQLSKGKLLIDDGRKINLNKDEEPEFAAIKARYFSLVGEIEQSIELLDNQLKLVDSEQKLRLLNFICMICFEHKMYERALPYARMIASEYNDRPDGYLAIGTCQHQMNDIPAAIISLQTALKVAQIKNDVHWTWLQLGTEFYKLKKYSEAIDCFEKIDTFGKTNFVIPELLFAYFFSGKLDKAEKLCLMAKAAANNSILINEVLFRIYEHTERSEKAEEVLNGYLNGDQKKAKDHFRLLGINFYHKIRDNVNLRRLLLDIENPQSYEMSQQFIVARMLLECNEIKKGKEVAYNARLENFEKSEAHELYVQCTLGVAEEPLDHLLPQFISMDNAVELVDKAGKKHTYFLTDDKRIIGDKILRSDDALTCMLLNKQRGTEILMEYSMGAGSILKIFNIMNRNVYAFRESLMLLETRFSGKANMVFFRAG